MRGLILCLGVFCVIERPILVGFANICPTYTNSCLQNTLNAIFKWHYMFNEMNNEVMQRSLQRMCSISDPQRLLVSKSDISAYMEPSEYALQQMVKEYRTSGALTGFVDIIGTICSGFENYHLYFVELKANPERLYQEFISYLIDIGHAGREYYNLYRLLPVRDVAENDFKEDANLLNEHRKHTFFKYVALYSGLQVDKITPAVLVKGVDAFVNSYVRAIYRHILAATELSKTKLVFSAIKGIEEGSINILAARSCARGLDAHTNAFSIQEEYILRRDVGGGFLGLSGVGENIDGYFVSGVVKGSPADLAGVRKEDVILSIDNESVDLTTPFDRIIMMLRGEVGDAVSLELRNPITKTVKKLYIVRTAFNATSVPDSISVKSYIVPTIKGDKIGVIRFDSFMESYDDSRRSTDTLIKDALIKLQANGINGLVIDLRYNGGGAVSQIPKIGSLFLDEGIMFFTLYKHINTGKIVVETHPVSGHDKICTVPVIILISTQTGSASECFAQAMQENHAAIVVGSEQSFGKGSMQLAPMLPITKINDVIRRSESDINKISWPILPYAVTVGFYYSPSGYSTQIEGVKSDIVLRSYRVGEHKMLFGEKYEEFALAAPNFGEYSSLIGKVKATKHLSKQGLSNHVVGAIHAKYNCRIANNDFNDIDDTYVAEVEADSDLVETVHIVSDVIHAPKAADENVLSQENWFTYIKRTLIMLWYKFMGAKFGSN